MLQGLQALNPQNNQYEITKIVDFTETCNLNIAEKKISIGNNNSGEFLPFPQGRADGGPTLRHAGRGQGRCVRIHRGLL